MPNANYVKGRNFEYRVISYFRAKNYYCIRAWGSKGVYDIIVIPKKDNPTIPFDLLQLLVPLSIKQNLLSLAKHFKNSILIQAKFNGYTHPKEMKILKASTSKHARSLIAYSKKGKILFKDLSNGDVFI